MQKALFGATFPTMGMKRSTYNSVISLAGCYFYADTWTQFFALVLILESLIVSIEGCWPKTE
jgi:hypothetical protein